MISQVTKATTGAMTRNTEERLKSINIETMMEPMTRKGARTTSRMSMATAN